MGLLTAMRRRRFPGDRPAFVMKTVLRGELPALAVAHTDDGLWLVADGVHHPDNADASQFVHLAHLVERDPTLRELADLPRGLQALRASVSGP
jgi:hypothetical protein